MVCWCGMSSRPGIFTDRHSALFKKLNPLNAELNPICRLLALLGGATIVVISRLRVKLLTALRSACTAWISNRNVSVKFLPSLQQNFTHTRFFFSSSFLVTLSLIRRTACARAKFSGYSSTTSAYSETGQMAFCCQNLPLGALSSRSAPSMLVGALFKSSVFFWTRLVCVPEHFLVWIGSRVSKSVMKLASDHVGRFHPQSSLVKPWRLLFLSL